MDFTSHDIAVIEQALQQAIKAQGGTSKSNSFQEVLHKLQANANKALQASPALMQDGFRYDYDDTSDLL